MWHEPSRDIIFIVQIFSNDHNLYDTFDNSI